ncbi:hypothetical protein BDN70DRAFT_776046, partial [Pholiota conissans]
LEIGSPMACMYLLGNPDHYTSHDFVPFWWKSYVSEIIRTWDANRDKNKSNIPTEELLDEVDNDKLADKVVLGRENGNYVGKSNVDDYKYCPECYSNLNLYQWIQTHQKKRRTK